MDNKQIESMFAKLGVNTLTVDSIDNDNDSCVVMTTLVMYAKFGESQDDSTPAIIPSSTLLLEKSDFANNRVAVRLLLSELASATPVKRRSSGSVSLEYTKMTRYNLQFTSSDDSKIVNNLVSCDWDADSSRGTITLENGVTFDVFSDDIDNHYVNENRNEREVYVCALSFKDSDDSLETSYGLTNLFKQLAKIDSPITGNASDTDSMIAESAKENLENRVRKLAVMSIADDSDSAIAAENLTHAIGSDSALQAIADSAIAAAQADSTDNDSDDDTSENQDS